jgi:glycosyltransferase involved in cell wall biosynthesis
MRILQICSARLIGGGERYLADLSNSLASRGHDVFVALAPDAPLKDELSAVRKDNILFSRMRNALDVFSAFKLADFARRNRIEIIHAHLARDYPLAALAARLAKKPFVLTRHVLFPLNRLQKLILKNVGGIVAPSNAIADALEKQNLFPSGKITIIRYGVNVEHFSPAEKTPNETFVVGTIGHLAPIKGHDVFVRAAEIVLKKRENVRFVIVGEDKSPTGKNRRALEDLIERLDLKSKIELSGWTDDVRPFLQKFDLFVSAARAEAFGLVIVEAMLYGLPVIATGSEGALEIIENDTSGILVPNEDAETLAKAILELFDDKEKREHLIRNGRRRVEEHFSLENMVSKTEEFYRRVLEKTV